MADVLNPIFSYMKERFRNPFFVNISVTWLIIHWKVIYITLFVSADDIFPLYWNKFDYVNDYVNSYKWYEDYLLPIVIGTILTLIKHPVLIAVDWCVEHMKVKRKDMTDEINKTGLYKKWMDSDKKVQHLSFYKDNKHTFLFYGNWLVKWVKNGDESRQEEYEYRFSSTSDQIVGNQENTTDKNIPQIIITNLIISFPKSLNFNMSLNRVGNGVVPNYDCRLDYSITNADKLSGKMTDMSNNNRDTYTITFTRPMESKIL